MAWARVSASAVSIAPDAHQSLEDLGAHADHRGGLGQPIGDRRLAGIGEDGATLAQALAPAGEDGLAPVVVRAAIAEGPVVGLGIPHDLVTTCTIVGGREAVLEGNLGDDLRSPVVGVHLLGRAVGIAPADAAGAEDLVESPDDGWRLGSLDAGELEAAAGVAAEGLGWEGGLEGLDLILGQYIDTSLNGWAGLCPLVGETKKGPLAGMGTALCVRDPHVHLRGDYYSILTGMHEMGCAGEKWMVMQCSRVGETREETTLSERPA